jgi:light-regulated signal transduction histidine kinase (bacteriophytochrome)
MKADGTYAYLYDKGYIIRDSTGKAIRIIGSTQDISRLKENELQLKKRAEELALSNLELEQFAFVTSHDLQEPLRMITSFLSQLEKKYDHVLDEKGKKYIHFAVVGAKRMRQIILDLLEYSRVGRNDTNAEELDMNEY